MTRKTPECYLAVFDYIEQNVFKMKPMEMMTDFEDGLRLAIRKFWPKVVIRGCWFHMSRAVHRRYLKLGLNKIRNNKKNAKMIRRMLMSIPLLPADRIGDGFHAIKSFAKKKRLFKRLEKLFDYFERYWLNNQVIYLKLYCLPDRLTARLPDRPPVTILQKIV